MGSFIIRWLCTTLAVAVAAWITGIHYTSPAWLFVAALLLGFVNAFVRPVLLLLSLPFIVVTLGAFILIVNTLLFCPIERWARSYHHASWPRKGDHRAGNRAVMSRRVRVKICGITNREDVEAAAPLWTSICGPVRSATWCSIKMPPGCGNCRRSSQR